jgi:hypothetical protein
VRHISGPQPGGYAPGCRRRLAGSKNPGRSVQQKVGWDEPPLDRVGRQAELLEYGEAEQNTVVRFAEDHAALRSEGSRRLRVDTPRSR